MYMRHLASLGLGKTDFKKRDEIIPNFWKPNTVPAATYTVTKSKRNNLLALTQTSLVRLK